MRIISCQDTFYQILTDVSPFEKSGWWHATPQKSSILCRHLAYNIINNITTIIDYNVALAVRSGEADRVVWSIVINGPISIMEGRDTKSLVGGITGCNPYGTISNLLNQLILIYTYTVLALMLTVYLSLYLYLCCYFLLVGWIFLSSGCKARILFSILRSKTASSITNMAPFTSFETCSISISSKASFTASLSWGGPKDCARSSLHAR